MPRLPLLSGDEAARTFQKFGYTLRHVKGSHLIMYCPGKEHLSIPRHRELDRGTLRALIRRADIGVQEFVHAWKGRRPSARKEQS